VTSNLRLADAPGNVRLSRSESGLSKPSVVNVSRVLTLDRGSLAERVGVVPERVMNRVATGLRSVLGL
jgi:mRNA interferase MazF